MNFLKNKNFILLTNKFFLLILISFFNIGVLECAPKEWDWTFQSPASSYMMHLVEFHDYLVLYLGIVAILISWIIARTIALFKGKFYIFEGEKFTHSETLEIVWTLVPAAILLLIAAPSFTLLYRYALELSSYSWWSSNSNIISVKVIGHQWYWSYEYSNESWVWLDKSKYIISFDFDSYMVATDDLTFGSYRLLEVDNRLLLPFKGKIRFLVTSTDVLHAFAVPSLGIKLDACPGRLSAVWSVLGKKGLFFGQCSEICGINHGFMPIAVYVTDYKEYIMWCLVNSSEVLSTEFVTYKKELN